MGSLQNQNAGGQDAAQSQTKKQSPPRTRPNQNTVELQRIFVETQIGKTFEVITDQALRFAAVKTDPDLNKANSSTKQKKSDAFGTRVSGHSQPQSSKSKTTVGSKTSSRSQPQSENASKIQSTSACQDGRHRIKNIRGDPEFGLSSASPFVDAENMPDQESNAKLSDFVITSDTRLSDTHNKSNVKNKRRNSSIKNNTHENTIGLENDASNTNLDDALCRRVGKPEQKLRKKAYKAASIEEDEVGIESILMHCERQKSYLTYFVDKSCSWHDNLDKSITDEYEAATRTKSADCLRCKNEDSVHQVWHLEFDVYLKNRRTEAARYISGKGVRAVQSYQLKSQPEKDTIHRALLNSTEDVIHEHIELLLAQKDFIRVWKMAHKQSPLLPPTTQTAPILAQTTDVGPASNSNKQLCKNQWIDKCKFPKCLLIKKLDSDEKCTKCKADAATQQEGQGYSFQPGGHRACFESFLQERSYTKSTEDQLRRTRYVTLLF